jgi:hypothetical protein
MSDEGGDKSSRATERAIPSPHLDHFRHGPVRTRLPNLRRDHPSRFLHDSILSSWTSNQSKLAITQIAYPSKCPTTTPPSPLRPKSLAPYLFRVSFLGQIPCRMPNTKQSPESRRSSTPTTTLPTAQTTLLLPSPLPPNSSYSTSLNSARMSSRPRRSPEETYNTRTLVSIRSHHSLRHKSSLNLSQPVQSPV